MRKTLMTAKIVLEFLLNTLHGPSCQVHGKLEIPLRNHTAHAQILHTYVSSLIEILWSDLTFKQQSSRIYHSAGTPVLLLSTLVYSEVALECLQSGKSGNFVA